MSIFAKSLTKNRCQCSWFNHNQQIVQGNTIKHCCTKWTFVIVNLYYIIIFSTLFQVTVVIVYQEVKQIGIVLIYDNSYNFLNKGDTDDTMQAGDLTEDQGTPVTNIYATQSFKVVTTTWQWIISKKCTKLALYRSVYSWKSIKLFNKNCKLIQYSALLIVNNMKKYF